MAAFPVVIVIEDRTRSSAAQAVFRGQVVIPEDANCLECLLAVSGDEIPVCVPAAFRVGRGRRLLAGRRVLDADYGRQLPILRRTLGRTVVVAGHATNATAQ